jgi:FdhD protein
MADDPDNCSSTSKRDPDVLRWRDGTIAHAPDDLVIEEPLEIRVRGRAISVTMRTPGHDAELAAGFLLTEKVIAGASDILRISPCDRNEAGNIVNVQLAPDVVVDFQRLTRHVFASSSCGLCGKATIDAIAQHFRSVKSTVRFEPELIATIARRMREAQATFDRTGGLHAAAIFDQIGTMLALREDIGRHNAIDKVLGYALLQRRLPLDCHVLLISGRASFEIVQKALAAGIPVIAAVSAPSSLAVDFAQRNGQTLIGFVRENRMNIYTHPDRLGLHSTISRRELAH